MNCFRRMLMRWELESEIGRIEKVIRKEESEEHQEWLRKVANSDPWLSSCVARSDMLPTLRRCRDNMRSAHDHLSGRRSRGAANLSLPPLPPLPDLPAFRPLTPGTGSKRYPGL